MRDINLNDLRLIDTSILMVFLGIMRHRKATAVAEEMGLTQPAVSHALKRLRALYGDPLFLRRTHGLEPTALARELEPKVRRIVRLISETLTAPDDFDPKTTLANLRIGAFDYELTSLLPDLVTSLQKAAPNISIHTYPLSNRDALGALIEGQIDMAVGYFDFPATNADAFVAEELFTEQYVLAAQKGHPLFSAPLTLERYATAEHLLISPFGPVKNMVDHALLLQGCKRNVRTTVPSLFSALSIVEQSELVVTLPKRVALRNAGRFSLSHSELPFDGGTFKLHAVRHARDAQSPIHIWLLNQLRRLSGQVDVAAANWNR